jgi:hypothetical protein
MQMLLQKKRNVHYEKLNIFGVVDVDVGIVEGKKM